ncbi:MAG: hypothetical protein CMH46_05990 [Muricauda sp.]|nr:MULTISPECIES: DUF4625 domain-containing protein [unclassified Allomuricauda]MAU15075.1 hypothetical protein [Allomuricauda sp.]|tara:strand:+ start:12766 stop:13242 length:477 start_codon:yes stop_codon:yes gene_type:complete
MKLKLKYFLYCLILVSIASCSSSDDTDIDEEKPTISVNYSDGFPQACEVLQRGQTYTFKAQATDNVALAAYSLDIHHNFDHHTHDDQGAQCELDDIKTADNPLIYMKNFTITEGGTSYEINISITIPEDVDVGDYHCSYSVTDATGWQGRTSVDIKII